ncbi:MAG: glycosyltransferase family 4 protein [Acidimicrobiales bacterium]
MRVAYLVNQYPKTSHSFIRREIAALEAQGVRVDRYTVRQVDEPLVDEDDVRERDRTLALLDDRRRLATAIVSAAVRSPRSLVRALRLAVRLGRRSDRGVLRGLVYLAEAARLGDELRRAAVGHVHAHFGTNSTAVALLWATLTGGTYSFTVHGPEEFDHPGELSLGPKIEHASFVVAVSDYGRSQLYRWCSHEHWSKIHVVRCTVDRSFLATEPSPVPDVPTFVCVGRLSEQKGQLLLVEAAIELAEEHRFELLFVGDGEFRRPLEELIERHDLGASVRILGWCSGAEVRTALLGARAMILPSFAEGLPVGIMEALALGRPVVSTYVAGIPELVIPGTNGWLVPAGSVSELVAAMDDALRRSPGELTAMGAAGHRAVAERHRDDVEAAKLAALLCHVPGLVPGNVGPVATEEQ